MNLNKKAGTLAKMIALLSAAYFPQAHADLTVNLGTLATPSSTVIVDNAIATGSFTDTFNFSTDATGANASAGSTAISYSITYDVTDPNEIGASLSTIGLYSGATELAPHGSVSFSETSAVDPISGATVWNETYTGTISNVHLAASSPYSLIITGNGGSLNDIISYSGNYTGTLNLSPVPEPEQWAMLMLGLPLISWVSRRKQANSSNAVAA